MKMYSCVVMMVFLLVFSSCKSKKKVSLSPEDMGSAKEIYEKAKSRMRRNSEKARLLFKEIMHIYPDSPYAQRSKIGIADSYFKQKDSGSMLIAAVEYQEYVNLYPHSPDAVYAKMQIGMCYYKQIKKPGRDQENTFKAIEALENLVKMFPDTEEAKDAREKIKKARGYLAAHYFSIGVSNYHLKAYRGAISRFKQIIDDYPDFKANDRLYYLTGKCYFVMRDYDSAISFFQRVLGSFPKSKYIKKSRKMVDKIMIIKSKQEGAKK